MAENASAQERTEDATPKRRQDARKKGSVAKSTDLTSAVVISVVVMALPPMAAGIGQSWIQAFRGTVSSMPRTLDFSTLSDFLAKVGAAPLAACMPLVGLLMVAGLAVNFAQVGFVLSGEAMSPKWERLNPFSGIKRFFSASAYMEGGKALVKASVFSYLAWATIQARWNELVQLSWVQPQAGITVMGGVMQQIAIKISIAWLALAAIDFFFQRKQMDKQLKMTKDELKQEFKESEQSAEVKQAVGRMRRRLSRGRVLDAVKDADLILTNPTHYSVALKYNPGEMHAPQVVAKGVDHMAFRIREAAEAAGIPIVPNPPLARQLYRKCEVGDFVPKDLFQAVAEVLAFVFSTIRAMR